MYPMLNDIIISNKKLNAGAIIEQVVVPEAGGINMFIGTVRNHTKGRKVLRLEYEAYVPMAEKEISKIIEEAREKWTLYHVIVHHRIGILSIEEKAVAIAVSSAHRHEAFESCRYIIEELKKRVPIWKKEVFEDGEVWVSANP